MILGISASPEAKSDLVLSLASRWLSECSQHQACHQSRKPPRLPTRVIDVGIDYSETASLISGVDKRSNYLVLSYCWGLGSDNHKLTKEKLRHGMPSVEISRLPKTLADAIHITRRL